MSIGCATPILPPVLKMPKNLPPIIKVYKHITFYGDMNTGIYLEKGEIYSIISNSYFMSSNLTVKIGEEASIFYATYHDKASTSGYLHLSAPFKIKDPQSIDIIVWEKEDWIQITDFFQKMKREDPNKEAIISALSEANKFKTIQVASKKTTQEIEETKEKIQELKGDPIKEKEQKATVEQEEKALPQIKTSMGELEKKEKIVKLEARLTKLVETLGQLEEMQKKLEEERKKTDLLTEQLAEKERTEKNLLIKLEDGSKTPPVIVIASPQDESKVEINIISLVGVVEDEKGVKKIEIFINGKPIKLRSERGIRLAGSKGPKRLDLKEKIRLDKGTNKIKVRVVDQDGLSTEKSLTVHQIERSKNVWAVVIGINDYTNIRKLKYAVNDAKLFYDYMINYNHIPSENVTLLLDQKASLVRLRSTLGTQLKNRAGKDDMVIIFFAGHGATEKDAMSPDGDGLEKYLLPYNANPKDLYATALPMNEISRIFNRIRSDRLVFIADSCYSGASGGRTIGIADIRTNISESFLDRIASGKG